MTPTVGTKTKTSTFKVGERVRFRDTDRVGTIVRQWSPWDEYRVRWDEGTSLVEASNVWASDLRAL